MENLKPGQTVKTQTGLIFNLVKVTAKFYVFEYDGAERREGIDRINRAITAGIHEVIK